MAIQEERRFAASPIEVAGVRHWIQGLAEQASFGAAQADLGLAVSEAASNVVRHSGSDWLTVRWRVERDQAEIEVSDEGIFDEQAVSPDGMGGFGIPMMAAIVDEFSLEQGTPARPGTRVRLVKRKS